jgi:hypothetical protein
MKIEKPVIEHHAIDSHAGFGHRLSAVTYYEITTKSSGGYEPRPLHKQCTDNPSCFFILFILTVCYSMSIEEWNFYQ